MNELNGLSFINAFHKDLITGIPLGFISWCLEQSKQSGGVVLMYPMLLLQT
jgi:hypothetical protein